MVSKGTWAALALAVVVGGILRFYQLTHFPPSMNWDEVSHAYNAWSLLHTGRDQWGMIMPALNFRAYGDYPTTMSLYGTVPALAFFGKNDFAARAPGATLGVLSIILAYGAGYYLQRSKYQAALLALLTAIEPWTFFTSRQVLQANWTVFLVFAFLIYFLRRQRIAALIILFIALFSYHNARIYVPLACGTLFFVWRDKLSRICTLAIAIAAILILLMPSARARNNTVGILDSGAIASLEAQRNNSSLPKTIGKLIYNRPVYLAEKVAANYLDYFSFGYLFFHGGTQYQFSLPKLGLLSAIDAPFFYLGLAVVALDYPVIAILLLLAPIPAAITQDRFAVVRSTIMLPLVLLTVSTGWRTVAAKLKANTLFLPIYLLLVVFSLVGYYQIYFSAYSQTFSQSWQYGYRQVINYINSHEGQYAQIIFTKEYGEPHEYLLWYAKSDLILKPFEWDFHDNWYWVQRLGKVHFVNDWELNEYVSKLPINGKYLIVSSPDNPSQGQTLSTINFLDGKPAFFIKSL